MGQKVSAATMALINCAQRIAWLEHKFPHVRGHGGALIEARRILKKKGVTITKTGVALFAEAPYP